MAPYPCFICNKNFNEERPCQQHLHDSHDWPFSNNLNDNLEAPKPWVCPYCSQKRFPIKEHYLYHVLNSCPETRNQLLYMTRHDKVLKVILDAAFDGYGGNRYWQINSVVKNYPHYQLPHGMQNKPGSRSPDILMYNRTVKHAVIIELSVPWESNIPKARQQALSKMGFWSAQFKKRDYKCFCYSVEIGSRGFIPSSFYSCLKNLHHEEEDISNYAQKCQDVVIKYSQHLVKGRPVGSDDEISDEDKSEEEEFDSYDEDEYAKEYDYDEYVTYLQKRVGFPVV